MLAQVQADEMGVPPEALVEVVAPDRAPQIRNESSLIAFSDALIECGGFGFQVHGITHARMSVCSRLRARPLFGPCPCERLNDFHLWDRDDKLATALAVG